MAIENEPGKMNPNYGTNLSNSNGCSSHEILAIETSSSEKNATILPNNGNINGSIGKQMNQYSTKMNNIANRNDDDNKNNNKININTHLQPPFPMMMGNNGAMDAATANATVSNAENVSVTDELKIRQLMAKLVPLSNNNNSNGNVCRKGRSAILTVLIFLFYNLYLTFAIHKSWHKSKNYGQGVKLLTVLTALVYLYLIINKFLMPVLLMPTVKLITSKSSLRQRNLVKYALFAIILVSLSGYIGFRCWMQPIRVVSLLGYFGFILLGYIFSKHQCSINWKQMLCGFTIQLLFGIGVLRTNFGKAIFDSTGEKINTFLSYTSAGTQFVFGHLATGVMKGTKSGIYNISIHNHEFVPAELPELPLMIQDNIFVLTGMPVMIYVSFFVSILYYYGIMQIVVKKFGLLLQATLGTTACESISASGNIFLGMCESPLLVKPFLPLMTKSELHAIMVGGFATIAGSTMAIYISFGISAAHLLSASVMNAPAALALSKLFYPETEKSKTTVNDIKLEKGTERNAIEAGCNGAISAISTIAGIVASLIAFVSFLAFIDGMLAYFGSMIDLPDLRFKLILSKLFIPLAMMLGVDWNDAEYIARLIGIKTFINEFVAYQELSQYIIDGSISIRSQTIATFALCGFANFASIGIQMGTLATMAPSRASDIAEISLRAMITGSVASLTTACVAGIFV